MKDTSGCTTDCITCSDDPTTCTEQQCRFLKCDDNTALYDRCEEQSDLL